MTREHGFTLVEMMVALFIFALLAAAGVTLLSVGVRAQATAGSRLEDTAQLRRMSSLLANDLAQIVPRTARDANGQALRAFTGNDGKSNPLVLGFVRAGAQRVDVALEGKTLVRRGYKAIDGTADANTMVLAENVTALSMRYRDRKGEWRPRWDNVLIDSLPAAVEMTVTRDKAAPLTLAFIAGPAYP